MKTKIIVNNFTLYSPDRSRRGVFLFFRSWIKYNNLNYHFIDFKAFSYTYNYKRRYKRNEVKKEPLDKRIPLYP